MLSTTEGLRDCITGNIVLKHWAALLICGFVCATVSSANSKRGEARDAIKNEFGKTGSSFAGVVKWIRESVPWEFILESVPSLLDSFGNDALTNCEEILKQLSSIGYKVRHYVLTAAEFGLPQHRVRFFFCRFASFRTRECLRRHCEYHRHVEISNLPAEPLHRSNRTLHQTAGCSGSKNNEVARNASRKVFLHWRNL